MKTMISVRLFAIALIAAFTVGFASPALALDEKKAIPVELKFVGNLRDQPVFHLVFNSAEENEFMITIRDEYGNIFFRENVKGTSFIKKFLLNMEEPEDTKLKFEVTSKGYDKPVVFEINSRTRYVDEVVVNQIK